MINIVGIVVITPLPLWEGLGVGLFVPYRLNRIHSRSLSCLEISEAYTNKGTYDEADGNAPTRNACREMEE